MTQEPKDVRLPIMVTQSEADAIDEWRYANRIPTRAEAMRRLVAMGLRVQEQLRNHAVRLDLLRMSLRDIEQAAAAGGPKHERERSMIEKDIVNRFVAIQALEQLSSGASADEEFQDDDVGNPPSP